MRSTVNKQVAKLRYLSSFCFRLGSFRRLTTISHRNVSKTPWQPLFGELAHFQFWGRPKTGQLMQQGRQETRRRRTPRPPTWRTSRGWWSGPSGSQSGRRSRRPAGRTCPRRRAWPSCRSPSPTSWGTWTKKKSSGGFHLGCFRRRFSDEVITPKEKVWQDQCLPIFPNLY